MDEKRRLMELMLNKQRQSSGVVQKLIPVRDLSKPAELSFAQQRLWFLDELTPGNAAYAFCNIVRLDGPLDIAAMGESFAEIVNRHENLRTTFKVVDGMPVQDIAEQLNTEFPVTDISALPSAEERETELQRIAAIEARKPFSLSEGPLIRASLVCMEKEKHAVILTMHHIVYDGWSLAVLFGELKQLYEAFIQNRASPLEPLAIQYADFAIWQRQEIETEKMQRQFAYWKETLGGQLPMLQLPTDRKRPTLPTYAGAMEWFYLSPSLSRSLEALARREDCTLFMVLLAAFDILLSRYSGEKDIIVGTPIANRNRREIENLIGFFINSLVMRVSLEGNPDFCQLLERVKNVSSQAYANQDFPFEKLVEDLQVDRTTGQNPVFQTMFALQNTPPPPEKIADMDMKIEEVDSGTAVFDITLSMYESSEGLNGYFEYSSELFDRQTIANMIESFRCLLEDIVQNPEKDISDLSVVSEPLYQKIVYDWNNSQLAYPDRVFIPEIITQVANSKPEQIAVVSADRKYSYAELQQQSDRLAVILLDHGVKANDFVAICLDRSFDMLVAILAVMKSGAAYLPLDPAYPRERLAFMLQDTAASIIISHNNVIENLPTDCTELVIMDELDESAAADNTVLKSVSIQADDTAYIIYTSGSTGQPKGVMVSHGNLLHSTRVRQEYYQHPVDAFLLMSSFSFDSSVAGLFWTLCDGGRLVLPGKGDEKDIFQVAALIQQHGVSHMLSLPSLYSVLLNSATIEDICTLKIVCVAGEECPVALVDRHFEVLPQARLFNEYGPTEGSVWSTVYECTPEMNVSSVPIGRPIPNVQVYILDKNLSIQPLGVAGEIYIAGDGISKGYLNRPELNAEKFIASPFADKGNSKMYRTGDIGRYRSDGNIEFLGRVDDQVKVRGYRIELGEIENAILRDSTVSQCAVMVDKTATGDSRIIAYIESTQDDSSAIEKALAADLPAYMLPSLFIRLDSMPLMPNGKIDRKALPDPLQFINKSSASNSPPQNALESCLIRLWSELLEIDQLSVNDNFFELGGHSILATRLMSRIYESFEQQLAIRYLFDFPTVRGLAAALLEESDDAERIMETAELMEQIEGLSEEEIDALMSENVL